MATHKFYLSSGYCRKGIEMKHYVLGFIFNREENKVLLVQKKRPEWQAGHWNGIGGKIEKDETPLLAMEREGHKETGHWGFGFQHAITFICPGGTVYVYRGNSDVSGIPYKQTEDELLQVWNLDSLPFTMMSNLKWIIPICLSSIQFPLLISDSTLGVE